MAAISALAAPPDFDNMPSDSIQDVEKREKVYLNWIESDEWKRKKFLFDMWCAAFVMHRFFPEKENHPGIFEDEPFGVTFTTIRNFVAGKILLPEELVDAIRKTTEEYRFFHFAVAFPEVTAKGGFDVMLGNPPWERIKLQEKEWFAVCRPDIANASNAAVRKKMIAKLEKEDPVLFDAWLEALRQSEGESHFLRNSGCYPLCGRGDINLYAVFAEKMRASLNENGRMGCIVPSGVASDDTTKFFFQDMVNTKSLVSLFDFENKGIFAGVHSSYKFSLLTSGSGAQPLTDKAEFVFFAHSTDDLNDPDRRFSLSARDIALLNPNTRTCPIFRSRKDAELTRAVYRRVPVLIREGIDGRPDENPWGIRFGTMFHMSNDSGLFRTHDQLAEEGWELRGNIFYKDEHDEDTEELREYRYLPLSEAKMVHHFNHRWATYEGTNVRDTTVDDLKNPEFSVLPRYWVAEEEVKEKLESIGWNREWLMGWRGICRATDERTVVGGCFPRCAVGHSLPIWTSNSEASKFLSALLSSFVCDFFTRFKVGGTNLSFFMAEQLAVLPPNTFSTDTPWQPEILLSDWISPRILELTYTAEDMHPFAVDMGYDGDPFIWDEERRFQVRAELDAAFFHLYLPANPDGTWKQSDNESNTEYAALVKEFPTPRHAVEHIMDSFPITKKNDEARYGTYRTKEMILENYDEMMNSMRTS